MEHRSASRNAQQARAEERSALLAIYATERADHQTQGTIQLAIIGAALAYTVVIAGQIATSCSGDGCAHHVPVGVLLAAPLPLFGLLSYLGLSAANSLQRAAYLIRLEQRLQRRLPQRGAPLVPSGFRRSEVIWAIGSPLRGPGRPLRLATVLSYGVMYVLQYSLVVFVLVAARDRLTWLPTLLVALVYGLWTVVQVIVMLGWDRDGIAQALDEVGSDV